MLRAMVVLGLMLGAVVPAGAQSTVVVVVRHAEAGPAPAGDPVLTERGIQRAHALARALGGAEVAAVITTHYARTGQTGEPTATTTGAARHVVRVDRAAGEAHIGELVERIRREYAGRTVLVVGHSNTVPQIIEALGGPAVPAIADSEHDRLYVLTLDEGGARLVASRYGDGP